MDLFEDAVEVVRLSSGGDPLKEQLNRMGVVLAEDHPDMLRSLHLLVAGEFDVRRSVKDGRALVEAVMACDPRLVVTDIAMPVLNGLDAVRELRTRGFTPIVIFVTQFVDQALVDVAFSLGASGYVSKARAAEDLLPAMRHALDGRTFSSI
jgi:DNA-binding NarL/FixJ family response regulator